MKKNRVFCGDRLIGLDLAQPEQANQKSALPEGPLCNNYVGDSPGAR
jgi:hypothetical protein